MNSREHEPPPMDSTTRTVGGQRVRGLDVDGETRCVHYDDECDVVALAFRCCDAFYPCFECHDAVTDHDRDRYAVAADPEAVLCGACGETLGVRAYLDADDACPRCGHEFNPGCRAHHERYFR